MQATFYVVLRQSQPVPGISFTQQTSAEANGPRGGTTTINSTFTRHTIDLGGSDTPD